MSKKWDIESIKIEAEKYKYRKDFQKNSAGAYSAAQRNGWLDIVCSHMEVLWEKKWTYENVLKEARKFNTRKEFQKANQSAYNAAYKNAWLDSVCKHMIAQKHSWTYENVKQEAKKYKSRVEFSKKAGVAYNKACRNGWLNDVCSHMKNPLFKWTIKLLQEEAKKYKRRIDFRVNSSGAYNSARKQGLLEEICTHMEKRQPWTFERVLAEAQKYKTRTEFRNKSYQASKVAKKNGWYEKVCSHMDVLWEEKWDHESVINEARKYKFRSDFLKGAPGAYNKARQMGWMDECQAHMDEWPFKWTEEAILDEALKYESRTEFAKNSGSAYKAASDKGLLDAVCKHMKILYNGYNHCVYIIKNDRLNKAYIGITSQKFDLRMQQHQSDNNPCLSREITKFNDTIYEQLTDYIYSPADVKKFAERKYVKLFEEKGYEILNDQKFIGSIGYSKRKWNIELCHIEALKYTTRWDFQKNSVNAYAAAKTHGWLNDICSHMEEVKKAPNYWTKERCILEAKKYKSKNDFRRKATYPYKIMSENGWTDEVCAHFPKIIYKRWEKKNADIEIWKKAQELYEEWIKLNQCSSYVLSRQYKMEGHKLRLIVSQFKQGWVPFQDESWLEWVSSFK